MYENPYNVPTWKKLGRKFWYWFSGLGWIVCTIILLLSLLIYGEYLSEIETEKEYNAFMFDCTKDHKEYECKVMWRQANPKKETTYVYIPR